MMFSLSNQMFRHYSSVLEEMGSVLPLSGTAHMDNIMDLDQRLSLKYKNSLLTLKRK